MTNEIEKQELELTPQQETFATAYTTIGSTIYSNATAAAIEAEYSEANARSQGWKMLQRPAIRRRIAEIHHQNMSRNYLTVDKVLCDLEHLRRKAEEKGDLSTAVRTVELVGKYLTMFSDRHTLVTELPQPADPERQEDVRLACEWLAAKRYLADSAAQEIEDKIDARLGRAQGQKETPFLKSDATTPQPATG